MVLHENRRDKKMLKNTYKAMQVTNDDDITFNVTLDKDIKTQEIFVSFYDTRYRHTKYGQHVARYYANTLLGKDDAGSKSIKDSALNLYGGVPDWYISAENSNAVIRFIEANS